MHVYFLGVGKERANGKEKFQPVPICVWPGMPYCDDLFILFILAILGNEHTIT